MFIFGCISEISIHRYFTHKSYTTTPFKEKILILFALLSGQGAIMSWVTTHRIHHANADTPDDAHSPLFNPWWKIMLGLFPRKNIKYSLNLIRDLMRSPNWKYYVFENSYYWLMWTAIWVVSLLISPWLFYFIVSGSALWFISTGLINVFTHTKSLGTQVYPDVVATNSSLLNLVTGAGHHHNHHKFPASHTFSVNGEIDIAGRIIEKIFMSKKS
jgi:stearoyl-CoA desaturase (delta-9 desaturase)